MTDEFLEEHFKTLLYDFGECNWNIITEDAWNKYINRDDPFDEKQLQDLRHFVKNLIDEMTDKPKS